MSTQPHFSIPETPMPFKGATENAIGIIGLLADTVRMPLHVNIGIDRLTKTRLAVSTGAMMLVSAVGNLHVGLSLFNGVNVHFDKDTSLRNYTLVVYLGGGVWQRMKRLREEKLGTEPHTYWPGDGRFYNFIPLKRQYIDLLIEPMVTFIAGAVCRYELGWGLLGLWLMAGAVALCITEKMWQSEMLKFRHTHNNIAKEALWWAEYERNRPKGAVAKEDVASSVTVPTGNDETLDALIEKNKRDNSFLN